jgi:hypothetical protein
LLIFIVPDLHANRHQLIDDLYLPLPPDVFIKVVLKNCG